MIETRQARYFVAVADELHFGRAAEMLQMSQPPLSQAIRGLERQIGARLLDRTSRRVALTEAGHAFLKECRVLLGNAERAERAASLAQAGATGTLRLGAVTSAFADPLLSPAPAPPTTLVHPPRVAAPPSNTLPLRACGTNSVFVELRRVFEVG